ncbi:MAG: hypothetical protein R3C19_01585 [Planctomycetaceae bacterium]
MTRQKGPRGWRRVGRETYRAAEILEDRTLLAVDAFGPVVDGYATDTNKDGTFPDLTTTAGNIRVRDYPTSAGYPGDDRGLLEFDVSSLGAGLTIDAAEFRLQRNAGYGGNPVVDVFSYSADGALTSSDATGPATLVATFTMGNPSSYTVQLDAAEIQSLYDASGRIGIRLSISPTSTAFGFGMYSNEGTPASFPEFEPTLTLTTSGSAVPSLRVTLDTTTVAETAGTGAVSGIVERLNADTSADLTVTLSSSEPSEAVPALTSVTIPAGSASAPFAIDIVDDTLLDGDIPVVISAAASGLASGSAGLLVTDAETFVLVAAESPIVESAGTGATSLTITRTNTDISQPLTVTLTETSSRLDVPLTATIPANETSVVVPVDAIDTEIVDGNTSVSVKANAPGYLQGATTIVVLDDDGGMIRPGNILVAVDDRYVREYKPDGTLIQTFDLNPLGTQLRDVVVNDQGDIEVINGSSVLTNIDVVTKATTNHTDPGWGTGGNIFSGGVAKFGQYLYVSDTGTSRGVIRFDTANGYAVDRADTAFDIFDVTIGLDGNLYALESGGGGDQVAVINPLTMQVLNTVTLQFTTHYGIAVNAAGEIFATGWEQALYKYNSQGQLIDFLVTGYPLKDIDIDATGRIVAAGSSTAIPYGYVVTTNEDFQAVEAFSVTTGLEVFVGFADPDASVAIPVVTPSGTPATLTENGSSTSPVSVIIDPGLTLTDDSDVMTGAVVRITGNYRKGQDSLSGFSQNGILYQGFSSKTGAITFSGTATVADYQAALSSVRFYNNSNSPDTNPRTITFSAINEGWIGSAETTVNVVSANDQLPTAADDSYTVDQDGVLTLAPVVTSLLTLQSDSGEYVGQGNNYTLTTGTLSIAQQYGTSGVRFNYSGTTDWSLNFWADAGSLAVGSYPVATRNGSNGSRAAGYQRQWARFHASRWLI